MVQVGHRREAVVRDHFEIWSVGVLGGTPPASEHGRWASAVRSAVVRANTRKAGFDSRTDQQLRPPSD